MEQRSDQWYDDRLGRFTASQAFELISDGRAKDSIGDSFYTLCKEKANEVVFGRDETWSTDSWDMKRGRDLEPEAFSVLKSIMAREFLSLEECYFFPYGENAGSSPDGIVQGKPIIAEIKCPRPEKVFELIRGDINSIDKKHLAQMQMGMLCTKSEVCYYFNYAIWKGEPIYHLIKVLKNDETHKKIDSRIGLGTKERNQYIEQIKSNKQF